MKSLNKDSAIVKVSFIFTSLMSIGRRTTFCWSSTWRLPLTGKGLFRAEDCHLCSPDLTRIILFLGLSLSNLRPSNQQPRELCLLFIPTILFPCTQDCGRGAPSLSFSLSRNWVLLERTVTFYVILYVAITFLLIFCSWHFPRLIYSMFLVY